MLEKAQKFMDSTNCLVSLLNFPVPSSQTPDTSKSPWIQDGHVLAHQNLF